MKARRVANAWVVSFVGTLIFLFGLAPMAGRAAGNPDYCWICKKQLISQIFLWKDKVTGEKERLCGECVDLPDCCYVCSMPLKDNYTDLQDTRYICERDLKAVMLDEKEILALCNATKTAIDSQLSRFLTLPEDTEFSVVDRQTIIELSSVPGNDFSCPNVMGYTQWKTNEQGKQYFPIAILSGQSRAGTIATCAHELGHTWTRANIPAERIAKINREAAEGFCELIAYLRCKELGETKEIANIHTNLYTRGQMDLFIAAEAKFGLDSVLDWMRRGRHDRLSADEPWRVQDLVAQTNRPAAIASASPVKMMAVASQPMVLPERLMLKSVSLGGKTPVAMINQCTLAAGETGKVRLAHTNLTIKCVAIRADNVTVEMVGSGERQQLRFEHKPGKH
jgi:hypothetical protein